MNKKILTIAIIALLAMTAPAFALTLNTGLPSIPLSPIPTAANSVSSNTSTGQPTVIAKAEWIITNSEIDDDSAKPWLQVNPASGFNASKTLGYLLVATGTNGAIDSLPNAPGVKGSILAAFADVYHPNGCIKYQVAMPHVISCEDSTPEEITQWIDYLQHKADLNLITFGNGWGIDNVTDALLECSAKLYWGSADINNCQMCGQFTWESHCEGTTPCHTVWTPIDNSTGYKVDAYVFDRGGAMSNVLENHFEFICQAGIQTDFSSLNYENVTYNVHKWIQGNKIWDPTGIACESGLGGCIRPSIRNIGNIPVNLTIWQDDMGFGQSSLGWNVLWDARLGEITEHPEVSYDPFVTTSIPGGLDLCQLDKISFSITPKKAQALGPRNGTVTITPVPVSFPWFTKTCGGCNYSVVPNGTAPYPGRYGGIVTPVTITNTDCGQVTALRTDTNQSFGPSGWAGWSCVEVGYPHVVGGGVVGGVAAAQGLAKFDAPAVGGFNYPVYPHYTFNGGLNTPGGEEGWVVQAGSPVPTGIYNLCTQ